jgi:AP endonuclease 2
MGCSKAEEGITGRLFSPSGVSYVDLPEEEQIGGYPASLSTNEALELDSEGRAVLLELPSFVFLGIYCPAVTITERDTFRRKFLAVLEERARNILDLGKAMVIAGDINICRAPIDTADPVGAARRTDSGVFEDTPTRRWLHGILYPNGPFVDTGRHFHPDREGMFTCKTSQKL